VKFALSGYWGAGNLGDESILAGTLAALRKCGVEPAVLSANPADTEAQHGVSAFHRYRPRGIARALKSASLLLSGGGGLLQDTTSLRSLLYYLSVLRLARGRGVPTMLFAQGIGPLRRRMSRALVRREADAARRVTVRDQASRELLSHCGVRREIEVTADASFLLEPPDERCAGQASAMFRDLRRPLVGAAFRPWGDMKWVGGVGDALRGISHSLGATIVFFAFDRTQDCGLAERLARECEGRALVASVQTPAEMLAAFSSLDMVIALRLHGAILSLLAGRPLVMLSYDPKCDAFCRDAGLDDPLALASIASDALVVHALRCWDERDQRGAAAQSLRTVMRARAQRNVEIALGAAS